MKHNGFTLVEMMAVIVLVALLAVIGVATYTNVNESAKEKTLESKKEHIRAAGLKWAKENNISNKTIISVNALVVEGYLTADENKLGEIGVIENPVTGENMICNTVDITLKEGEYIATVNDKDQNCTLATQSLVDTNINIKVVDEKNIDRTGSGSISAWTNQNVMIIVTSNSYDSRMTSISYDFEGNTVTKPKSGKQKYTGNAYISEGAAENYYNVFHVNAALLLNTKIVVTYNIAGENSKSRAYTIRIDKEEASANISSNSEWLTVDKDVYITVDDGKGSGPKYFYISKDTNINNATRKDAGFKTKVAGLEIGRYYVWTEDVAGNISTKYKIMFDVNNVDKTEPGCEVLFHGTPGNGGWYKESPVTPGGKNTVKAGISGMNIGVNTTKDDPEYTAFAAYNEFNEGLGTTRTTNTSKSGVDYYCHAKTLAGKYANAKRNLKLDMTPPTITIDTTSDTNYTQIKSIKLTIADGLSGLPERLPFRWGWSKSQDCANLSITEFVMIGHQLSDPYTSYIYGPNTWFGQPMTGKYYLCIDFSQITDYAGNHATSVNGKSGGGRAVFGPYYFDNTPPTCDGNNGKTNWTKGTYTIKQECGDEDGTKDQSGCEKDPYVVNYLAFQTVKSDSVIISDKAGNTTTCPYDVYLDNTKPVCDGEGGKTNWTKGTYTVQQKCKEDVNTQSGCAENPFTKSYYTWQTVKDDKVQIKDNVGNTKVCDVHVYLDNIDPTCGTVSGASTTWTKDNRDITVECIENADVQSGCKKSKFTRTVNETVKTSFVQITDNAGNSVNCGPYNMYVDKTPPTCGTVTGQNTTWTTNAVKVTVQCGDGTDQSGCEEASYSKEHSTSKKTDTIKIKDKVGNETTCGPYNFYVDTTAPSCGTVSGASTSWTNAGRTVTVGCSDSHSGCTASSYSKTHSSTKKTDSIEIKDNVGNTKNCGPYNFYVDTTAPSCKTTATQKEGAWTNSTVTVTGTCSDDDSGCKPPNPMEAKFSDEQATSHIPGIAEDYAGNKTECKAFTVRIERTIPNVKCTVSNQGTTAGVSVTFSALDNLGTFNSGLDTSRGDSSTTGLKKTKTFTAYDYAGNSASCKVTVTSQRQKRTKSCSYGKRCSDASGGCASYKWSCGSGSCGQDANSYTTCSTNSSCSRVCDYYARDIANCGCASWGDFGDWSDVTSCSAGESSDHSTTTGCRTIYS